MKIGIDARLYAETGIGRYISNLIKYLEEVDAVNDYVIFVNKNGSERYRPQNPRFKKWLTDVQWYTAAEQILMAKEFYQARLDLLHVPHFNLPVFYLKKSIVTIHDLTIGSYAAEKGGIKDAGYKFVVSRACASASKIISPSQAVLDELIKSYPLVKSKGVVTYEGFEKELAENLPSDMAVVRTRLEEMGIREKYFLYVGACYPHKNLNQLIVSFKEAAKDSKFRAQLVIAGPKDVHAERLAGFVHAVGLDGRVIFAAKYTQENSVSERDLGYLYKAASIYVFPSLSEGFSITPLEAQAFGVPVLLSDIPVHKEVFGNSAFYFNPKSNIDISERMVHLYGDEAMQQALVELGRQNVEKYSWRKMAEQTLQVYSDTLGQNS
jgi:glycosyltransferase involved in cell wall biosynthesis